MFLFTLLKLNHLATDYWLPVFLFAWASERQTQSIPYIHICDADFRHCWFFANDYGYGYGCPVGFELVSWARLGYPLSRGGGDLYCIIELESVKSVSGWGCREYWYFSHRLRRGGGGVGRYSNGRQIWRIFFCPILDPFNIREKPATTRQQNLPNLKRRNAA